MLYCYLNSGFELLFWVYHRWQYLWRLLFIHEKERKIIWYDCSSPWCHLMCTWYLSSIVNVLIGVKHLFSLISYFKDQNISLDDYVGTWFSWSNKDNRTNSCHSSIFGTFCVVILTKTGILQKKTFWKREANFCCVDLSGFLNHILNLHHYYWFDLTYAGPWARKKLHFSCCFRGCTLLMFLFLLIFIFWFCKMLETWYLMLCLLS